jgi:glycerol-3-phosphate acyltransferase PlsY
MFEQVLWLAGPAAGYLIGAIPFSLLVGLLFGVDIRRHGNGNVGAGNLTKAVGLRAGAVAALLDGLKGLLTTLAAQRLGAGPAVVAVTGMAAVVGHNWSIYLRGRSGRGLATSVGVLMAINPAMLVWTGGWSVAGWKLGGGLGGFVGWAALPVVAVLFGRPASDVLVAFGLALLMLARRMQGSASRQPGLTAAFHRAVFDDEPSGDAVGNEERVRLP